MDTPWRELMAEINPEALFIGTDDDRQFDSAIVGYANRCGQPSLLVYDYDKIVEVLKAQGMTLEEAEEYVNYNICGAWMGDQTPLILHTQEF